jgi:hypothetical protein
MGAMVFDVRVWNAKDRGGTNATTMANDGVVM